jgi:hypothetical protein
LQLELQFISQDKEIYANEVQKLKKQIKNQNQMLHIENERSVADTVSLNNDSE